MVPDARVVRRRMTRLAPINPGDPVISIVLLLRSIGFFILFILQKCYFSPIKNLVIFQCIRNKEIKNEPVRAIMKFIPA